ncbi:MAG: aminoglycoside phosphotransferase family protein [Liquorilactobacillus nagelii]|jgi:hypothetical protein|uniref:aminoglycoside phosphotransferase family protein n=1 Tax=Liquorilactobacillus nagelii TaxID=82688 RepID=UPI00242F5354|nr:aminoglycoside phosphotransferase family protein [Liquorilactobacillus nagelii]MCI1632934.1 aminoglycoside phosphotransferase family protein [Liquorilactobacillus nagelii]MCI1921192.1 aminoglycoside phosphotransferase family protein [Liquorilactobacillus nagelii]MCI1977174.1 aminoglycoside phosphotransferase family protein [Liquorilactobacillus nagelii]
MLIDFLNDYYQAELKSIHDVAGNQHLIGNSQVFHGALFVKIFKEKDMFYAEQHVNQVYAPDVYLDSVIFEDNYVITLRNRHLREFDSQAINEHSAYEFGKLLGDFHKQLTGKVTVTTADLPLSSQLKQQVARLQSSVYAEVAEASLALLKSDLTAADVEFEQLPKVVLHGDFSVRNIMHYHDRLILIDFERSHMGVSYQDFIKFFYNEVKSSRLRQKFLDGYETEYSFEIPSHALQRCLLLQCALDICEYHLTHPKKKYGTMAQQMLGTIKNNDAVLAL